MNNVMLGLFGSAVRGDAYRDVDLVAFGSPGTIRSIHSQILKKWDSGMVRRLSLNGYGGGGGGKGAIAGHQGVLDITLFDNQADFDTFARRNSTDLLLDSNSRKDFWTLLNKKTDAYTARFVTETFTPAS